MFLYLALHRLVVLVIITEQLQHVPGMNLLEVGPGGGALTKYLLQWDDVHYKAIEIDEEKALYLDREYPAIKGKIILQDILKADAPFSGQFSVIGNFPYNISSPILFKVLEWEPQVTEVLQMDQAVIRNVIAKEK